MTYESKNFNPAFDGDVVVTSASLHWSLKSSWPILVIVLEVETSNTAAHPPGSKAVWSQKLEEPSVFAWSVAYWVAACSGHANNEPEKIIPLVGDWKGVLADISSRPDYLAGSRVHLRTTSVRTRNGLNFTRYDFSPARQ